MSRVPKSQQLMICRSFLAGDGVELIARMHVRSTSEIEEALRRSLVLRGGAQRCMESIRDAADGAVYECRLEPGHMGPCDLSRHPVGGVRRALARLDRASGERKGG